MLADYAKYMKKYTEMTKKMDDIESMDLNDAENLYFLDVQTRVNAKLAEIAKKDETLYTKNLYVSESLYIRKKMYVKGFLCHGDRKYNCIC